MNKNNIKVLKINILIKNIIKLINIKTTLKINKNKQIIKYYNKVVIKICLLIINKQNNINIKIINKLININNSNIHHFKTNFNKNYINILIIPINLTKLIIIISLILNLINKYPKL